MLKLYAAKQSPFGRRIALWLTLQGRDFQQEFLSTMADFDALKAIYPGGRAPVLELPDGARLVESFVLMDWLEETAAASKRLLPPRGPERRDALQTIALAHQASEKAVALFYETNVRPEEFRWPGWVERLEGQLSGTIAAVESRCPESGFFGDAAPVGADIGAVCLWDFLGKALPDRQAGLTPSCPKLAALAERANALAPFSMTKP